MVNDLTKPRLLIISDMPHHIRRDGGLLGWAPTVAEIDRLATLFLSVTHIGWLFPGDPAATFQPYGAKNIEFIAMHPSGGVGWMAKLQIMLRMPAYFLSIVNRLRVTDVVHVRCPANISLLAIVALFFIRWPKYRWVKYAGNWCPGGPDPLAYRFQRWWLTKNLHRGLVTINGSWPGQPKHVISFDNPSLTESVLRSAREESLGKQINDPLQLLFVGLVSESKGAGRLLQIARLLKGAGLDFCLDVVGGGEQLPAFQQLARDWDLYNQVIFHDWIPHDRLAPFYRQAHILVFPSASEGWPKVLSEAMAYGVVPIAGAVSSIPQILAERGSGKALPLDQIEEFVAAILEYRQQPKAWKDASMAGYQLAERFTYTTYLQSVRDLISSAWGLHIEPASRTDA